MTRDINDAIKESFNKSNEFRKQIETYSRSVRNAFWAIVAAGHERKLDWYFIRDNGHYEVRGGHNPVENAAAEKCFLGLQFQRDCIKFTINDTYRSGEIGNEIRAYKDKYISADNAPGICQAMTSFPQGDHGYLPNDYRKP
ncbi:hypothetical protein [Gluconobacter oxydans]|uniref:hypothetical protein n=1 Tax=Gluconobacter oxydans TaxID=442 RepID=UPI0039EC4935